jgi:hypothetical protein
MLHQEVKLVMRVAFPVTIGNAAGTSFDAYAEFNTVTGAMGGWNVSPAVKYPIMTTIRKYCESGRGGRYMFVGAMREIDVNYAPDGRVYLKGLWSPPQLQRNYFNNFMLNGVFKPYVAPSYPGNSIPDWARKIRGFGNINVLRITTLPDAQDRKTIIATPFRKKCHDWVLTLAIMGTEYKALCFNRGVNVPKTQIISFRTLLQNCGIGWAGITDYYTTGLSSSIAPEWRPTAGLDPYFSESQELGQKLRDVIEEFASEIEDMLNTPGTTVPSIVLQESERRTWQMAGIYALFFERERFPGTPIPHPNV